MSCKRKIIESIFNSRLSCWLEQSSILPPNMFGFRQHTTVIDCVSSLFAHMPSPSFGKNTALFLHIKSTYPSAQILTLMMCILALAQFIGKLMAPLILHFWLKNLHPLQRTLPQGSPLSPNLFNIHILRVAQLKIPAKILLFTDDIVLYSSENQTSPQLP